MNAYEVEAYVAIPQEASAILTWVAVTAVNRASAKEQVRAHYSVRSITGRVRLAQ